MTYTGGALPPIVDRYTLIERLRTWVDGVETQRQRAREATKDNSVEFEWYLLVVTLRQLLRWVRRAEAHEPEAIGAAVARFDAALRTASMMRNVLEHLDEYDAGRGTQRRKVVGDADQGGPVSIWWEWSESNDQREGAAVNVGTLRLELEPACDAGIALGQLAMETLARVPFAWPSEP